MEQKQLLETRYLPATKENPDFWEKHYNYDSSPEGECSFFRFNTTFYLNPSIKDSLKLNDIKTVLEQTDFSETSNLIKDFKKCEIWLDEKDYKCEASGVSIDFCAGNEIVNKIRGDKAKYTERWTLEIHIRLQDPKNVNTCKRMDAITDFNEIKNQNDLISKIINRVSEFNNSISINSKFLRDLNKKSCTDFKYVYDDILANENRRNIQEKKLIAPQNIAPRSSKFKQKPAQPASKKGKVLNTIVQDTYITEEKMARFFSSKK